MIEQPNNGNQRTVDSNILDLILNSAAANNTTRQRYYFELLEYGKILPIILREQTTNLYSRITQHFNEHYPFSS